jgi:hypothetical protein
VQQLLLQGGLKDLQELWGPTKPPPTASLNACCQHRLSQLPLLLQLLLLVLAPPVLLRMLLLAPPLLLLCLLVLLHQAYRQRRM